MDLTRSLRKRLVRKPARTPEIAAAYRELLGRAPTAEECALWERLWLSPGGLRRWIGRSPEARARAMPSLPADPAPGAAPSPVLLDGLSDGDFAAEVYETVMGRHPSAAETAILSDTLRANPAGRAGMLAGSFVNRVGERRAWREGNDTNDTASFPVMGTSVAMPVKEWRARRSAGKGKPGATRHARFPRQPRQSEVDVSILCSLWCGGAFIERYLENITSQTIFDDRCELIVIDAASPENEAETIERFAARFGDRIVYRRLPWRAGIYVAWNMAAGLARGRYLTNANLDDLRRVDSLDLQSSTLDALPHVDVVYQDFLYSADEDAGFGDIQGAGVASDLPLVTPHNLFAHNPPHNAPMWRASLHERIGLFDEGLRSAGDYDFWVRAAIAGANFYKTNDPHVAYYYNPEGISTARNTRGIEEPREVLRRHGRDLLPKASVESPADFLKRIGTAGDWPVGADGMPLSRYALVQGRMRDLAGRHRRTGT